MNELTIPFTDTYFVRDGNKQAYLLAGKLLNSSRYGRPETVRQIFLPNRKNEIIDYDGTPAVVVRIRFMNAVKKQESNVPCIFILLNQLLTEEAIHELYPEVWTAWHNVMARREANRQAQQNRMVRKNETSMHGEILNMTRGGNVRKFLNLGIGR